jgi:hypothetical protein
MPEGETVLLVGKKGEMKSQMVYHLITCVTKGKEFAEEVLPVKRGRVVLFNSERSIHKVVRPRLEAAAADVERVQIVPWASCKDFTAAQRFLEKQVTADEIAEEKSELNPDDKLRLVFFDVVADFKKPTASDVREAVLPLSDYCEQHGITVVFVLHLLHKGTSDKSLMGMISGSQSWVQVCSTILAMAMVDVTPDLRLPSTPWFKGIRRVGVFEVTHTNLDQSNARWWYKWEGQLVEPLPRLQSSLNVGDVGTMSVIGCLRIGDQKGNEAANRSPRQHCIRWLMNWLSECTEIPPHIRQKGEQEGVRVRAARRRR